MGLIKAALGSAGGVMAEQWKEFFYCDSLAGDTLVVKGQKRQTGRSSNKHAVDNIITSGSIIAVADGQCAIIVEQGKVVDITAEPGEFTYDASTEPSVFCGDLSKNIPAVLKNIGKRFTFGGEPPKDQRVYYVNTKELVGNKYGTPAPIPFRVVDTRAGFDMDITISCHGEYSYRITNPVLFYTNLCGNVKDEFTRSEIDSQLKTELLDALQPAFAKISDLGIRYSALPAHTKEVGSALNDELSQKWGELRGIEIVSFGIASVKTSEENEEAIRNMQSLSNPNLAAATLAGATAKAMTTAAANEGNGGAAMAFMGMNMAGNQTAGSVQNLFQMGQQQQAAQQAANSWQCACGQTATGNFCPACGAKKPEPKPAGDTWQCSCGATATGKFCPECGAKKTADGWQCSCGTVNKGKFCSECGAQKPAGAPLYQCDKCGWQPEDPKNPPKFCPECGDPFDDADIKS